MGRFKSWKYPKFDDRGFTKWGWMVQHPDKLTIGRGTDIGAFTYINAQEGVDIEKNVWIGSHCSIYSVSTIDEKRGCVVIRKGARIGSHSIVMPGVTIGEGVIIGALSFVNKEYQQMIGRRSADV